MKDCGGVNDGHGDGEGGNASCWLRLSNKRRYFEESSFRLSTYTKWKYQKVSRIYLDRHFPPESFTHFDAKL